MVPPSLKDVTAFSVRGRGNTAGQRLGRPPANVPVSDRADVRALMVWAVVLGGMGVILGLVHVWARNQVVEAGYRLSATRQLVERLEREERELEVLAAAADTPGRLEELARTRLGMRRPQRGEEIALP